jgi:hypothetical protein
MKYNAATEAENLRHLEHDIILSNVI